MIVDQPTVFLEYLYRNIAKARRGRDREALLHVLDDLLRRTGEWFGFCISGDLSSGSRLFLHGSGSCCWRFRLRTLGFRYANLGGLSRQQLVKICLPRFVNRLRILLVTREQTFNVRRVSAKIVRDKSRYFL